MTERRAFLNILWAPLIATFASIALAGGSLSVTTAGDGHDHIARPAEPIPSFAAPEQLKSTFDTDLDGWTPGVAGRKDIDANWGTVYQLDRAGGIIQLDGTGAPGQPNAWISRVVDLAPDARVLKFDVGAHDQAGSDARFTVRLVDANVNKILLDEVVTNATDSLMLTSRSLDIAAWAGHTVTLFFEQDDNGFHGVFPGADEQLYLDNVVTTNGDRDGDGLLDTWEEDGIDTNGDGTPDLDLKGMGASPDHKDVFVELDYMVPHAIPNAEIAQVVEAFADAPVANPDGVNGIALHVDNGPSSEMDPATHATWGGLSRQNEIAHVDELGSTINGMYDWGPFQALKDANFDSARKQVFHYAIAAHSVGFLVGGGTASGISRGSTGGASDFIVSQGKYINGVDTEFGQGDFRANTFMHELGHNLGLRHGGADSTNYKPNYLSVMNYAFDGLLLKADQSGVLDYSRFQVPLDESNLDETLGFDISPGSGPADFLTIYSCPGGTKRVAPLAAAEVDWNCDGSISTSTVSTDVNGDGQIGQLASQTDWDKLVFDGGLIGAKAAPELPMLTPNEEPTRAEIESNAALLRACAAELATGAANCTDVSAPAATGSALPTAAPSASASPGASASASAGSSPGPSPAPVNGAPGPPASTTGLLLAAFAVLVLLAVGGLFVRRRRSMGG